MTSKIVLLADGEINLVYGGANINDVMFVVGTVAGAIGGAMLGYGQRCKETECIDYGKRVQIIGGALVALAMADTGIAYNQKY